MSETLEFPNYDGLADNSSSADHKEWFTFGKKEIVREMDTFVIPDIHGDVVALINCLKRFDLVDDDGKWKGENVRVVLLGDLIDRGGHDKRVLETVIKLKEYVEETGGEFVCLLGNHELFLLNAIYGDVSHELVRSHIVNFKYRSKAILRDFGLDPEDYLSQDDIKEVFLSEENKHFMDLFSSMKVFYQFDDTLAVHGMVTPYWADLLARRGAEYVNNHFWQTVYEGHFGNYNNISASRSDGKGSSFNLSSPMWADFSELLTLGNSQKFNLEFCLEELGVNNVVCGHQFADFVRTIQIGNKQFLCIDTAMTRGYDGVTSSGGMHISRGEGMDFVVVNGDGSWHTSFDEIRTIRSTFAR